MSTVTNVTTPRTATFSAAPVLSGPDRLSVRTFSTGPLEGLTKASNGTGSVSRLKIFKSGTFKDSLGIQHTWLAEHLEQMVSNFGMLQSSGRLQNVPVREGHPSLFGNDGKVVGYIGSLFHEGGFLLADFEFTEPEAAEKYDRGTYRGRSAEVGYYESNDEALFWPVLMGFAFVDIPAVEGLFGHEPQEFTVLTEKEIKYMGENNGGQAPTPPTPPTPATPPAPSTTGDAPPATPPAPSTGDAPATPPPADTQHAAPGTLAQFTIGGQVTTDFAAVQSHITTLETEAAKRTRQERIDFVKGLAGQNKVPATMIGDEKKEGGPDGLIGFALGLNDEQYKAFQASYGAAPESPLFQPHGHDTSNHDGTVPLGAPEEPSQEDTDLAIVNRFKMSRAPKAQIEASESYQRLKAAGKAPALT